ncbi:MAG: hemerythrin domain-containing protein [Steroidobacteraceae bacterium]
MSSAAAPVVEQIKTEHRALARVIGAMQALVTRWRAPGEKPDLGLFDAMLRYIENVPDRMHHPKEDRVLFPAIASRSEQARELIAQLMREHEKGEHMIAETRGALNRMKTVGPRALEGLATAVEEFAEFYWWHLHREEVQLLPLAHTVLSDDEWHAIAAAFQSNVDPLFGAECAAEYRELYERIVELTPQPLKSLMRS